MRKYTSGPEGGLERQSCMSQGSSDYSHSSQGITRVRLSTEVYILNVKSV